MPEPFPLWRDFSSQDIPLFNRIELREPLFSFSLRQSAYGKDDLKSANGSTIKYTHFDDCFARFLIMAKPIIIAVGPGELIDKWTILQIKKKNIEDASKLANITREIDAIAPQCDDLHKTYPELLALQQELSLINQALWQIEDEIRLCERKKNFGHEFIELARSVYIQNDRRASVKKKINILCEAEIIEEKSYEEFE